MFAPPLLTVGPCLWWENQGVAGPLQKDKRHERSRDEIEEVSGSAQTLCRGSEEGEPVERQNITNRRETVRNIFSCW